MGIFFKRDPRSYSGHEVKPTALGYVALVYLFLFFGCGCVQLSKALCNALNWLTGEGVNGHLFEIAIGAAFFLAIGSIGAIWDAKVNENEHHVYLFFVGMLLLVITIAFHLLSTLF